MRVRVWLRVRVRGGVRVGRRVWFRVRVRVSVRFRARFRVRVRIRVRVSVRVGVRVRVRDRVRVVIKPIPLSRYPLAHIYAEHPCWRGKVHPWLPHQTAPRGQQLCPFTLYPTLLPPGQSPALGSGYSTCSGKVH